MTSCTLLGLPNIDDRNLRIIVEDDVSRGITVVVTGLAVMHIGAETILYRAILIAEFGDDVRRRKSDFRVPLKPDFECG